MDCAGCTCLARQRAAAAPDDRIGDAGDRRPCRLFVSGRRGDVYGSDEETREKTDQVRGWRRSCFTGSVPPIFERANRELRLFWQRVLTVYKPRAKEVFA